MLVALFVVRSLSAWLRWWGIPIFTASLFTLVIGVGAFFMFDWVWGRYVLPYIPSSLSSSFGEISHDVARTLANDLAKWITLEAGLLTLLALGIIVISARVKPPPDPSLPPLAPAGTPGGPILRSSQKKKKKGW